LLAVVTFHHQILSGKAHIPFDNDLYHYPLLYYSWHELSRGHIPLYDPYVYSGVPFYLNTQAGLYYPLQLTFIAGLALLKIQATQYLMQLINICHFALGGTCFYFLARHYGIRPLLATPGAVLFVLTGHVVAQSQHLGVIETFAWLPLVFLLLSKLIKSPGWGTATWLGIVGAQPILIGFLPQAAASVCVVGVFAMVALAFQPRRLVQKLGCLALAAIIAIGLTAIVTVPLVTIEQPVEQIVVQGPRPVVTLESLLSPNIFATFNWPIGYKGPCDPTVDYMYAGSLTPALMLLGLIFVGYQVPELTCALIFSAVVTFGPASWLARVHALSPVCALVRPHNFLFFIVLFGVLLALLALERLQPKRWWLIAACGLMVGAMAVTAKYLPTPMPDSRSAWAVGVSVACLLGIVLVRPRAVALIALVLAAEVWVVNMDRVPWIMPGAPDTMTANTLDCHNEDLLNFLRNGAEPHRVAVNQKVLQGPWNTCWRVWGIEAICGFEPIRSEKYFDTVTKQLSDWHETRLFNIAQFDSPVLNCLNVRYYVTRHDYGMTSPYWRRVFDSYYDVYENARFHSRYAVLPADAVNVNEESRTATYAPAAKRAGRTEVIDRQPGLVRLGVAVDDAEAFLFISERNYAGWQVRVDGQRVRPVTVNDLMMGLPLQQGQHLVSLRFRLPYLWLVLTLTGVGIVLAAVGFGAARQASQVRRPQSRMHQRFTLGDRDRLDLPIAVGQ
jgi:hypothetical protein